MAETQTQEPQTAKPAEGQPAQRETVRETPPRRPAKRGFLAHPIRLIIILVTLVAAGIAGYRLWNYFGSYESTDDAQVDGDIYAITSRIAGTIKAVYVEDNQPVKAGQVLVDLDPRDYDVALAQAKAALNSSRTLVAVARPSVPITTQTTQTTLSTSATDIAQARASLAAAQQVWVLDGELRVRDGDAEHVLAAGDCIALMSGSAREYGTRSGCRYLVALAR